MYLSGIKLYNSQDVGAPWGHQGRVAPNSRLGFSLCQIINNYVDCANVKTECRSSEDMHAAFEEFNNLDAASREKCMDVKDLYPSMSWEEIITAVKEMIINSDMDVMNVDWAGGD